MEIVEFLNQELKNKKWNLKKLNKKIRLLINVKPYNARQMSLITEQLQLTQLEAKQILCVCRYLQETIEILELTELNIKNGIESKKYAEISELLRQEMRTLALHINNK